MSGYVEGSIIDDSGAESFFRLTEDTVHVWGGTHQLRAQNAPTLEAMQQAVKDSGFYALRAHDEALGQAGELDEKARNLARVLLAMATGAAWQDADEELRDQYREQAMDHILSHPHLLTLAERHRLTSETPHLSAYYPHLAV